MSPTVAPASYSPHHASPRDMSPGQGAGGREGEKDPPARGGSVASAAYLLSGAQPGIIAALRAEVQNLANLAPCSPCRESAGLAVMPGEVNLGEVIDGLAGRATAIRRHSPACAPRE
jgi:hypothetical protein